MGTKGRAFRAAWHGWFCAVGVLAAVGASSCASFAYVDRGPGSGSGEGAYDVMTPRSEVRWSFLWGRVRPLWSAWDCTQRAPDGSCLQGRDPCDGKGAGRVDVALTAYSVPLALLTLGAAVPAQLTIYCSTSQAPSDGPCGEGCHAKPSH